MSNKYYKSVSDLNEVDQILALAKKSLGSSTPVLQATSSGIPTALAKAMLGAKGVGATLAAGSVVTTGVASAGFTV